MFADGLAETHQVAQDLRRGGGAFEQGLGLQGEETDGVQLVCLELVGLLLGGEHQLEEFLAVGVQDRLGFLAPDLDVEGGAHGVDGGGGAQGGGQGLGGRLARH